MKPTRRGFLGTLGAIVAVPTALIADTGLIKDSPQAATHEIRFCTMKFIDAYGGEMVCEMVPFTSKPIAPGRFHFRADVGRMGSDFGVGMNGFGPISRFITTIDTDLGPIEIFSDVPYVRYVNVGEELTIEFDGLIEPV